MLFLYFKVVRTRNGLGSLGNDSSDDPDGNGEADEGILHKIACNFIWALLIPILANHIWSKTFLYIVSNEHEEEGDSSQTTVAVILVIAWCLVAIVAFFYYKKTKTGIINDILSLEYGHIYPLCHMICFKGNP